MKTKQTDLDDDYKLTLVYHKIIYCKKREIDNYINEAKKNKLYVHSLPERIIKQEEK